MNSKERVLKMIQHQEPDRVPVGEWGIDHDHVEKIIGHHSYWRNRKDSTIALWEGRRDEVVESLKNDCVELVEKLDYDVITVELVPPKGYQTADPPKKTGEGTWADNKGRIFKYAASNDSISCMTHSEGVLEISDEKLEEIYNRATKIDESTFELIDFIGEKYKDTKAILCRSIDVVGFLDNPFGGDYNHSILLSMLCPEEQKKLWEACRIYNKTLVERCKKSGVSICMQGHDFGMNTGCIISPNSIRDVYMPAMKMVNSEIEKVGMVPFFHCCGNIWDIMDDFVGSGYKGYQSIQETAHMDTRKVKELYGDKITLWTGIQCETLVSGSIEDARNEVKNGLSFLMNGGGFIFGSTNSVQYGAKTDNYLAALDVIRESGVYR